MDYNIFEHTAEDRILLIDDINDLHYMPCPSGLNSASFGIRINDDSMNKSFDKYSYVFLDFGAPVGAYEIGLFYYNGQILIRRLSIYGKDRLSLVPDNSEYPKIKIKKDDKFYIIGKIIQ